MVEPEWDGRRIYKYWSRKRVWNWREENVVKQHN